MTGYEGLVSRLWQADVDAMPAGKRHLFRGLRIAYAVGRDVQQGDLTLRAMSLVYTTLLSMVPLLAISFSVLKGFGVQNELQPFLINLLEPLGPEKSAEVTGRIIEFVENTNVGVLGAVGLCFLLYTVISLLQKIEGAFNAIWRITRERTLARRFSDYLSVIVIGPVLMFGALGLTAAVTGTSIVERAARYEPITTLIGVAASLVPYVLVVGAFTFINVFMPNTRVRLLSAFVGALIAGVLWASAGFVFTAFVADSNNYNAIYSAFATLMVFMIWLYVNWLILLVGGTIAFYHQRSDFLTRSRTIAHLSNRVKERIALSAMLLMTRGVYDGASPLTQEQLSERLRVPRDALGRILGALRAAGLIAETAARPPAYLPARAADATPVKAVLDAVRTADERNQLGPAHLPRDAAAERVQMAADRAVAEALEAWTVKDVLYEDRATSSLGGDPPPTSPVLASSRAIDSSPAP